MGRGRTVRRPSGIVYASARGSSVLDVDGNRYVDLAGGFGALLVGHAHPSVSKAVSMQVQRLSQALGDVYPSEPKIELADRLARLHPKGGARVILGQSGADAVSAALKSCVLATGRPGVIAFRGGYHGLSYGPLAVCGLRESYRAPFSGQLNPGVAFADWPRDRESASHVLGRVESTLKGGAVGAVIFEPIQGRGGVVLPPPGFLPQLGSLVRSHGALVVADEIWTGLGRSGRMLFCSGVGLVPDILCLGKGLGGGLPISACLGTDEVMGAWSSREDVVHTATFAGAPLACAAAVATLDVLSRDDLVDRSSRLGQVFLERLRAAVDGARCVGDVRGAGLMVGVELSTGAGAAVDLQRELLRRGYIVSTGGGRRDALVLTPPLTIDAALLDGFVVTLADVLGAR